LNAQKLHDAMGIPSYILYGADFQNVSGLSVLGKMERATGLEPDAPYQNGNPDPVKKDDKTSR